MYCRYARWLFFYKIHTLNNLQKEKQQELLVNVCQLHYQAAEDVPHLFLHCPLARQVWGYFLEQYGVSWVFKDYLMFHHQIIGSLDSQTQGNILWGCTLLGTIFWAMAMNEFIVVLSDTWCCCIDCCRINFTYKGNNILALDCICTMNSCLQHVRPLANQDRRHLRFTHMLQGNTRPLAIAPIACKTLITNNPKNLS